jgi:hypothetical protein
MASPSGVAAEAEKVEVESGKLDGAEVGQSSSLRQTCSLKMANRAGPFPRAGFGRCGINGSRGSS